MTSKSCSLEVFSLAEWTNALLQMFRGKHRPRIVKYLIAKSDAGLGGAHISEVATKLRISKGSAFVNLSELERWGFLTHKWRTLKCKKTTKSVKVYSIHPFFLKPRTPDFLGTLRKMLAAWNAVP